MDELVVVDGAGGGFVEAGVYGVFEVGDVPLERMLVRWSCIWRVIAWYVDFTYDVGYWEAVEGRGVGRRAVWINFSLVELVVHDEVGLPIQIEDPTLVRVASSCIRGA